MTSTEVTALAERLHAQCAARMSSPPSVASMAAHIQRIVDSGIISDDLIIKSAEKATAELIAEATSPNDQLSQLAENLGHHLEQDLDIPDNTLVPTILAGGPPNTICITLSIKLGPKLRQIVLAALIPPNWQTTARQDAIDILTPTIPVGLQHLTEPNNHPDSTRFLGSVEVPLPSAQSRN
jgi:hypothetical protein